MDGHASPPPLLRAGDSAAAGALVARVGIGLRGGHFVRPSRDLGQVTVPEWPAIASRLDSMGRWAPHAVHGGDGVCSTRATTQLPP
jgi:hypothetical protein